MGSTANHQPPATPLPLNLSNWALPLPHAAGVSHVRCLTPLTFIHIAGVSHCFLCAVSQNPAGSLAQVLATIPPITALLLVLPPSTGPLLGPPRPRRPPSTVPDRFPSSRDGEADSEDLHLLHIQDVAPGPRVGRGGGWVWSWGRRKKAKVVMGWAGQRLWEKKWGEE